MALTGYKPKKSAKKMLVREKSDGTLVYEEDVTVLTVPRKKPNKLYGEGMFCLLHLEFAKTLYERCEDYTHNTFRVLFYLMYRVDYNNRIGTFTQAMICKDLDLNSATVSTSIRRIKRDGIIHKLGQDWYFNATCLKYSEKYRRYENYEQEQH